MLLLRRRHRSSSIIIGSSDPCFFSIAAINHHRFKIRQRLQCLTGQRTYRLRRLDLRVNDFKDMFSARRDVHKGRLEASLSKCTTIEENVAGKKEWQNLEANVTNKTTTVQCSFGALDQNGRPAFSKTLETPLAMKGRCDDPATKAQYQLHYQETGFVKGFM